MTKIQREKEKEAEDRQSADLQRTQEYERLKQEKELEISNLKGKIMHKLHGQNDLCSYYPISNNFSMIIHR